MVEIEVLNDSTIMERRELGLLVPMDVEPGLQIIDCGDDRPLTFEYWQTRRKQYGNDVVPGRYFGTVNGIALTGLIELASSMGGQGIKDYLEQYPEGFVGFAADLSQRASDLEENPIEAGTHSADGNEQNPHGLTEKDTSECQAALGCAFAAHLGVILCNSMASDQKREAIHISQYCDISSVNIGMAIDGIRALCEAIPKDYGVSRQAVKSASERYKTPPTVMHAGSHADNQSNRLTLDFGGFRSDATTAFNNNLARYHHTPSLAPTVLSRTMSEFSESEPNDLIAASLLLAVSTRRALSPNDPDALKVEIILPEA